MPSVVVVVPAESVPVVAVVSVSMPLAFASTSVEVMGDADASGAEGAVEVCAIAKPVSASRASSDMAATRTISIWVLKPMNTAARPTRLCIAATSCGISVICTRCAMT